ncbi:Ubiquitin carboxyl-terminal hydrolase 26 [Amphibalanus amphitrite]|uniref:Ubiquitin carboxyl-terminal hydrolase 26 n=1 Tax=Amphibalanus amphitrite TaxID=1232801 RepID=A0A6A4WGQ6_AMPAM|nr:Ubiquitin carboxyl-terminal hydrolase 26 [Amphibalanus amphitrite]
MKIWGTEAPTLQDALRLSMRPDRRHLLCQHCRHDECYVTTKISQLPRTLILQLNRCVFLGDEAKKIRTKEDQSLRPVDLVGNFTYRLVGVVSHYGGATHSGHYVSDVYSVGRDMWFHFDDQRVSCVDEAYSMSKKYVP